MQTILSIVKNAAQNKPVYIVGGWLRDTLLRRPTRDIDFACACPTATISRKVARALKGAHVLLDRENKIYRVVLKNNPAADYLDFSPLKGADIDEDLSNRDFTVNAMALEVTGETPDLSALIDPQKGKTDVKKRIIRMTSEKAFVDDPLRLLRAWRCAAELGFTVDTATRRAIKKHAARITTVAWERIRDEFFRILSVNRSAPWIEALDRAGLLTELFPEVMPMQRSAKRFYFHPKGLWQHAMETLSSMEEIFDDLDELFPGREEKIDVHLAAPFTPGINHRNLLKAVALFHDVAKPSCAVREGKKMRFLGHDTRGGEMIADLLRRLRTGRNEVRAAQLLVEQHMRLVSLGQSPRLTDHAVFRVFRDMGTLMPDLVILSLSDCYSYRRLKTNKTVELKKMQCITRELMDRYYAEQEKPVRPRLIDGNILIKKLNLKPGPVIGKLLDKIQEAQALGKITTSEEALDLARKLCKIHRT